MKRQRLSPEQWLDVLNRQKQSGQNDSQWAAESGVGVASLRAWRKKLSRSSGENLPPKFIEVASFTSGAQLKISLPNGLVVAVSPGWPSEHLVQTITLLKAL